jgi:tryptophan 7-halogenase
VTEQARRLVVVVGAGLAGQSAGLALVRALPRSKWRVMVVPTDHDEEDLGFSSPVEPTLPSIRNFHADLGIDEDALVRDGIASFSLGTAHSGWMEDGGASFAPFGDIGASVGGVAFHQYVARLREMGEQVRSTDYSIAALMAQAGRFARPSDDPRSPLSSFTYGLHLQRRPYVDRLKALAEGQGAEQAAAPFAECVTAGDQVEAVLLRDGKRVAGDLFVDASGPRALLLGSLPVPFQSWRHWFPANRLLAWEEEEQAPPACYALVAAHGAGWQRTVPGPGSVGQLLAYASDQLGDTEALARAGGGVTQMPRAIESGRRERSWVGNTVAIGGAAGVVEPTAPVALHLAQQQIGRLLRLFPSSTAMNLEASEYVRETSAELDRMRDFLLLRRALAGRRDTPYWRSAPAAELPAELHHKISLYRSRGRVPLLDGDEFGEAEWAAEFEGLGVRPARFEALAEAMPADQLKALLGRMREAMFRAIAPLPRHADYLAAIRTRAAA